MNDKNYNSVPKPDIRFEGKDALKKRGHFVTIAWISSSVAAAMLISAMVLWPSELRTGESYETIAVVVQNSVADTVVAGSIENKSESKANETQTNITPIKSDKYIDKQSVKETKDVTLPPPKRQNNKNKIESEVDKRIEPIRKREVRPTISIKPQVELAMIEMPKIEINPELDEVLVDQSNSKERDKNPNIEQFVQLFKSTNFVSSNLAKTTERERTGNPNIKKLFEKPKSSLKEVFFSKNDEN